MNKKERLIERWENVVRVLNALTPHQRRKHWDMSTFGIKTECGTVACAAGHCSLDPWFRRRGLVGYFRESLSGDPPTLDFETSLHDFFDDDGVNDIFYNEDHRPVSQVIREVKAHIKTLRAGL